jgi:hypothetical protein
LHLVTWGVGAFFRSHSLVVPSQDGTNVLETDVGGGGAVAQPLTASATSNAANRFDMSHPCGAGRIAGNTATTLVGSVNMNKLQSGRDLRRRVRRKYFQSSK